MVDDEVIIARDLQRIVKKFGVQKVQIAISYESAIAKILSLQPHLILLDINLNADKDGIAIASALGHIRPCEIIFISAHSDTKTVTRAQLEQPCNFIVKPFDERQVQIAVQLALANALQQTQENRSADSATVLLTKAEKRITLMIANHLTSQEIANHLGISYKTVENHRYNICRKLKLPREKNSLLYWAADHKKPLLESQT